MFRNGLEPWHLILLLAIILLMFGSTKLPELARGVGRSIRIFKSEMDEGKADKKDAANPTEPAQIEGKVDSIAEPAESAHIQPAKTEQQV